MPRGVYDKKNGKVGLPIDDRSPEEAREIRSKGGKKRAALCREKKLIRETFETILSLPIKDDRKKEMLLQQGIIGEEMTQQTLMAFAIIKKAQSGDSYAAAFIRDTIGQKEVEKVSIDGNINNPLSGFTTEELKALIDK